MSDPIADMLNRIRNAQVVSKETVKVPFSILKNKIAIILEREGWIEKAEQKGRKNLKHLEIKLKYQDGKPAISGVKKISKPGQRIYSTASDVKRVRDGFGMAIVSTSKGLMTDKEIRRNKVGGEILFQIW